MEKQKRNSTEVAFLFVDSLSLLPAPHSPSSLAHFSPNCLKRERIENKRIFLHKITKLILGGLPVCIFSCPLPHLFPIAFFHSFSKINIFSLLLINQAKMLTANVMAKNELHTHIKHPTANGCFGFEFYFIFYSHLDSRPREAVVFIIFQPLPPHHRHWFHCRSLCVFSSAYSSCQATIKYWHAIELI